MSSPDLPAAFVPRNLVVVSDGTGNSAAQLQKTNVWRLYEALDLSAGDQLAIYDDGVGTASFKPLAILGGVFGYGLKRNVLDLYMFLCRNYRHVHDDPSHGDRIFVFGFSRGAYTARVVAAMVAEVGLVHARTDTELRRLSLWAYRAYRAKRFEQGVMVRLLRKARDVVIRGWERLSRRSPFDPGRTRRPDVAFLGVWDTVAAYGLPIDELTRGWERWIWPMLPKDRRVSGKVRRACHALALDDERQTFFPLLWTEQDEPHNATSTHLDQERLTQVWFAGVHSNVGGGYPDDGLSLTPLAWMATEAAKHGLRLRPSLCLPGRIIPHSWEDRAVAFAPMNDSRRGLGVYYRYHPRPVERLCRDRDADVLVPRPKIHESVFLRIRDGVDGYAPIVLPEHYAVVTPSGEVLASPPEPEGAAENPYESASQSRARRRLQEHALNAVWWRRVVYFLTVAATLTVVLTPLCPARDRLWWFAWESPPLASVVGLLDSFLPGVMAPWLDYYQQRPWQLAVGVFVIVVLLGVSTKLKRACTDRMRGVWEHTGLTARPMDVPDPPTDLVYRLRTSAAYRGTFHFLSHSLWPNVFGIALLVTLAVVLPVRLAFEVRSRSSDLPASTCGDGGMSLRAPSDPQGTFAVWPHLMCNASGLTVEEGVTYRLNVVLPETCEPGPAEPPEVQRGVGAWRDADITVDTIWGFSTFSSRPTLVQRAAFLSALPLRRVLSAHWFAGVLEIGRRSPARIALSRPLDDAGAAAGAGVVASATFVAPRDGPLSMFVNDALLLLPTFATLYQNNAGGPARVRVVRADAPEATTPLSVYSCGEQVRLSRHLVTSSR